MIIKCQNGHQLMHVPGDSLRKADLRRAYLVSADLYRANLCGANLRGAKLLGANLCGANLWDANLRAAYLRDADLRNADLRNADLRGSDLGGADLRGADLRDADLRRAKLKCADLEGAKLPYFKIIPSEGSFIAWKKVKGAILKLEVPAEAKRTSSLVGRKCRVSIAKVLEAVGAESPGPWSSVYETTYCYHLGETVAEPNYCDDIRVECAPGIHVFASYEEARDYK